MAAFKITMIIQKIVDQNTWNNFFNENGSPSFLQSWEWGEVQKNLCYQTLRLGVYQKNDLHAIAQIIKIKAKRGKFLFIPHGPIFSLQSSISSFQFLINQLLNYLITLSKKENFSFIRVAPVLENRGEYQKIFKDLGFKTAPIYMHAERLWVLSIDKTEDQLLAQMRKTTRYLIRKALREKVVIEKRNDEKAVDDFYRLYEETARREKFVPFSKKFIKEEFEAFNKTGNALFLFGKLEQKKPSQDISEEGGFETISRTAANYKNSIKPTSLMHSRKDAFERKRNEGNYFASALIIFTRSTAFYHQGASIHTKVPVAYLLQWEAIRQAKKRGCHLYNFWGILQEGRTPKNWQGLTLFKTGFGGCQIDYLPTQDYVISPKYYLTWFLEKFLNWRRGV